MQAETDSLVHSKRIYDKLIVSQQTINHVYLCPITPTQYKPYSKKITYKLHFLHKTRLRTQNDNET